jgi:hypothetical protein
MILLWRDKVCVIFFWVGYGFSSIMVLVTGNFLFHRGRPGLGSSSRSDCPLRNFEARHCTVFRLTIRSPSILSSRARISSSDVSKK